MTIYSQHANRDKIQILATYEGLLGVTSTTATSVSDATEAEHIVDTPNSISALASGSRRCSRSCQISTRTSVATTHGYLDRLGSTVRQVDPRRYRRRGLTHDAITCGSSVSNCSLEVSINRLICRAIERGDRSKLTKPASHQIRSRNASGSMA